MERKCLDSIVVGRLVVRVRVISMNKYYASTLGFSKVGFSKAGFSRVGLSKVV